MSASDAFLDLLRDHLAPLGHITIKRMFMGAGVYCDGVIFAIVADEVLYLKADAGTKDRFEAEGLGPFTYESKSKLVAIPYWRAPDRLYDEPVEMLDYAREAIAVAIKSRKPSSALRGTSAAKPKAKASKTKTKTPKSAAKSVSPKPRAGTPKPVR